MGGVLKVGAQLEQKAGRPAAQLQEGPGLGLGSWKCCDPLGSVSDCAWLSARQVTEDPHPPLCGTSDTSLYVCGDF